MVPKDPALDSKEETPSFLKKYLYKLVLVTPPALNQSVSCDGGTVTLDTSLVGQCGPDRKPEETMVCVEAKDTSATAAADSELIEACGSMFMTAIDYEEKLVKSLKASLHTQSKALTAAFETVSPPSFYKDKSHLRKCVTKVQVIDKEKVKDDGDVVKQILHNCKTSENVRFEGIGGIHYGIHHGHLQVRTKFKDALKNYVQSDPSSYFNFKTLISPPQLLGLRVPRVDLLSRDRHPSNMFGCSGDDERSGTHR